jgi:hypothetical protein
MTPMSASSPSATASQPQSPDIQQLVGLLGSLMPLLLRFQSQAFPSQVFPSQVFPSQVFPSQVPEQPFQAVPGSVVIPNPALDHLAAENLIGDVIAESLRTLSSYLEAHAGLHAGLESCVPIVTQAAHRFAARDYAQAFNLIWLTYRVIETIRAADPRIPTPRAASSDPTSSSIH